MRAVGWLSYLRRWPSFTFHRCSSKIEQISKQFFGCENGSILQSYRMLLCGRWVAMNSERQAYFFPLEKLYQPRGFSSLSLNKRLWKVIQLCYLKSPGSMAVLIRLIFFKLYNSGKLQLVTEEQKLTSCGPRKAHHQSFFWSHTTLLSTFG